MFFLDDVSRKIPDGSDVVVELLNLGIFWKLHGDFYRIFLVDAVDDHASFLVGRYGDDEGGGQHCTQDKWNYFHLKFRRKLFRKGVKNT